jgi:hypothetical protein
VSLNQIVATLLLQDQTTKISLTALHQNCIFVFKYLKGRNCNSFVTIEPTLFAVKRIVERLGFKTQPMLVQTKGRHNELEIMLNPKLDQQLMLGLSYYSASLSQNHVLDSGIATILSH